MDRRYFLRGSGAAGLGAMGLSGCAKHVTAAVAATAPPATPFPFYDAMQPLIPIRADVDRIFRVTVCTRPFRPAGPRLDAEKVGDKMVFHNYGHGGSGWSLSWGSADVVVKKVLAEGNHQGQVAVIGCGALGMTAALTAQRYGLKATIYARERPPYVRSVRATGSWTPDSRIALRSAVSPDFGAVWEQMARTSLTMYESFIGMAGNPIEWMDHYSLSDGPSGARTPPVHQFATYRERIAGLMPGSHELPAGTHPFPTKSARRSTTLTFNVADYARQLMNDFQVAGGRIEMREFHTPQEMGTLMEHSIINATGYAARQLWSDETLVPVRGQIAWLIPQDGVHYGIQYNGLEVLARRDGIVVQPSLGGDDAGWNDDTEVPDRAAAEAGVRQLQELYGRMEAMQSRKS